jgi:hypothetical protein
MIELAVVFFAGLVCGCVFGAMTLAAKQLNRDRYRN